MHAEFRELPALMLPRVNRFFKANGHKGKAKSHERVFVLEQGGRITAALRACPEADGYLLRSVWVASHMRSQGLGTALLTQAVGQLGLSPCWCYPFGHLKRFYQQSGFIEADINAVPATIASRYLTYSHKHQGLLLMYNRLPS